MSQDTINFLSLSFAALSSIAALIALTISLAQTRAAVMTNRAQIYLEFSNRYNSGEINAAIIALARWHKNDPNFAIAFRSGFIANDPAAVEINIHRRNLHRYFHDVAQAYSAGVLNDDFARLATNHPGARVWARVCCPMTRELYGKMYSDSLTTLKVVLPTIEDGEIF